MNNWVHWFDMPLVWIQLHTIPSLVPLPPSKEGEGSRWLIAPAPLHTDCQVLLEGVARLWSAPWQRGHVSRDATHQAQCAGPVQHAGQLHVGPNARSRLRVVRRYDSLRSDISSADTDHELCILMVKGSSRQRRPEHSGRNIGNVFTLFLAGTEEPLPLMQQPAE